MNIDYISSQDTICALSTPAGSGAIAIIRLSGDQAVDIVSSIFFPKNKKTLLADVHTHTAVFGTIGNNENIIDEVLVTIFRAPHSYTSEDVVEISCHGSVYIQQKILEILLSGGARLAEPGCGRSDSFQLRSIAQACHKPDARRLLK